MGTIRFSLQTDVKDKDGKSFIQLVYQIAGNKKRQSTGEKVFIENWDKENQCVIFAKEHKKLIDSDKVREINNKLTRLRLDIEDIEKRFEANKQPYSIEDVFTELAQLNKPVTKRDASSKELYAFMDRYINDHQFTVVKGSLSVYKSLKMHLEGYEKRAGVRVSFDKINYSFFQGFQNYLVSLTKTVKVKDEDKKIKIKTVKRLNNITIAKQLSTLKTFLNYAKAQGIEVSNKYETFTIKRETDLEVIALTRGEFETLYNLDLSKHLSWDQVRNVFIFSCATGLRYSDLKQLRWEHIKDGFIDLTAIKTSHKTKIPLNPYSRAILKKYEGQSRPLPVISNQRSNEHLGKICDWAGINEKVEIVRKHGAHREVTVYPKYELIRMHCGRKTFATLSLENGMPAEQVMKIGGWKDYKSFKRYMDLTDDSSMKAMQEAWGAKIIKPKLKAV